MIDDLDDLDWDVDDFLYLLNSWDFDDLFDDLFNGDNLWDFNDPFNNLLNNLFYLDKLGYDSEDFENIIDIDHTHNFLVDHANDSLVDLEDGTCS